MPRFRLQLFLQNIYTRRISRLQFIVLRLYFSSSGIFADREKMIHVCPQCVKGFPNQSSLNKHMTSHSDYRPFQCVVCSKKVYGKLDNERCYIQGHLMRRFSYLCFCPDVYIFIPPVQAVRSPEQSWANT